MAFILLSERPPTRSQLASLLFAEADDPLWALRWSLSEIRRALGGDGSLEGDPVVLELPADAVVDVDVLMKGSWTDAVGLAGRINLLRNDLDTAAKQLDASIELAERDHWLAILPWP